MDLALIASTVLKRAPLQVLYIKETTSIRSACLTLNTLYVREKFKSC